MSQSNSARAQAGCTSPRLWHRWLSRLLVVSVITTGTSCVRDGVVSSERPSLSLRADSLTAVVDSNLALYGEGYFVRLTELPDLIVTDGALAVGLDAIQQSMDDAVRLRGVKSVRLSVHAARSSVRVFRSNAGSAHRDTSLAQLLSVDAKVTYASPGYANSDAPSDTLYLLNRLVVEFRRALGVTELEDFLKEYGLSVLSQPTKANGLVNYEFRYPSGTRDPLSVVHRIANDPRVRLSAPDMWNTGMREFSAPNDPLYGFAYPLNSTFSRNGIPVDVRAELAWGVNLGQGTTVAVIDNGIYAGHPDLVGRVYSTGSNTTGSGADPLNPAWPNAHGTAIAGIIGANRDNAIGIAGLAPATTLVSIQNYYVDNQGSSQFTSTWSANAIDQARTLFNVDVINGSWGSFTQDGVILAATDRARTLGRGGKGIALVFATGNNGSYALTYPASNTGVISVGAIGPSGTKTLYGNGGTRLDVVAPSSQDGANSLYDAFCTVADGVPTTAVAGAPCVGPGLTSGYIRFSGTSSTAPQVAAIAALVISQYPTITSSAVRDRIKAQSDPWGSAVDFGSGKANAYLALVGRLAATIFPANSLVPAGVVTKNCSASNGTGAYSYRWYLSYTSDPAGLFDTGITTTSFSQSMYSGEQFIFRCVASDGVQTMTVDKILNAN